MHWLRLFACTLLGVEYFAVCGGFGTLLAQLIGLVRR